MDADQIDQDTGEVRPNGNGLASVSGRASAAAANARLQEKRDRVGHGAMALHHAIAKAQARLPVWITTDAEAHISEKSRATAKYATLKAILTVVRPILTEHGIRLRQGCERSFPMDDGGAKGRLVLVYTDLVHEITGEYERTVVEIPITRLDPRAMGSALTYGRRYTLLAALGLASDEADDDGKAAMPRDLSAPAVQSNDLVVLKTEVDKHKDLESLTKWATDKKNLARINQLDDGEAERLREHYSNKREKLSTAE